MLLFGTVQTLKMFLCTSFDLSSFFYTSTKALPFQDRVQGNRAIPSIWLIISILLIRYLYSSQFISISKTVMIKIAFQLVAQILY